MYLESTGLPIALHRMRMYCSNSSPCYVAIVMVINNYAYNLLANLAMKQPNETTSSVSTLSM